jgi:potassium-transporting ATPase KdpC subunit
LGPSSDKLRDTIARRVTMYRAENGLGPNVTIPSDAVTASASGLDPDISVANARLQAARVAGQRHLPVARVMTLIDQHTDKRSLGYLGDPGVNVLLLNRALDATN